VAPKKPAQDLVWEGLMVPAPEGCWSTLPEGPLLRVFELLHKDKDGKEAVSGAHAGLQLRPRGAVSACRAEGVPAAAVAAISWPTHHA
jgi:hypothetical protein